MAFLSRLLQSAESSELTRGVQLQRVTLALDAARAARLPPVHIRELRQAAESALLMRAAQPFPNDSPEERELQEALERLERGSGQVPKDES